LGWGTAGRGLGVEWTAVDGARVVKGRLPQGALGEDGRLGVARVQWEWRVAGGETAVEWWGVKLRWNGGE
jgi:hypothetical protein